MSLDHLTKYPHDVAEAVLRDVKTSFEKNSGFTLEPAEWANLRHSLFASLQGHYIHLKALREMK